MREIKLYYDLIYSFISGITIEQVLIAIGLSNVFIIALMFRAGKHFRHSTKAYDRIEQTLVKNTLALEAYWDSSCVWKTAPIFFRNMCSVIVDLEPGANAPLYIYRGYDQGGDELTEPLQHTILEAMVKERISDFYRVAVVTSEASIHNAARWMRIFANEAPTSRCHFYVAFRRKFNLGSFVALGHDDCFIAMPKMQTDLEIGGPSKTHNGVFVKDRDIGDIIRDYIRRLQEMAGAKSFHVIRCPLTHRGSEAAQQRALEDIIRNAFRNFLNLGK